MRLAVISDVHGNHLALEAALADIGRQSPDAIVNLGDHVSGPVDPAATADLLIELGAASIRGNHDRWLVEDAFDSLGRTDKYTMAQLKPQHLEWLKALPVRAVFDNEVLLSHGTPDSDETYWLEQITETGAVALKPLAEIERAAKGLDFPVLLCGHTHTPRMIRLNDGRMVLNPGSVGCPAYTSDNPKPHMVGTGAPDARYAILDRHNGVWSASLRSVPYDHAGAAALARAAGRPDWASALATGWVY